jgi:hypothetical protein
MSMETYSRDKKYKWVGGSLQGRKAFTKERDDRLISLVNTYLVLTTELAVALMDMERTPSNMAIVDRALKRLAKEDEKSKHFRQIRQDGVTYFVSLEVKIGRQVERAQLVHRTMQSRFWGTLDRAVAIEHKMTDREFRTQGGVIIPDGYFVTQGQAYFLETNTGRDAWDGVLAKAREYQKQKDYLCQIFGIDSFRVLWVNRSSERMAQMMRNFPPTGLFLVTHESDFDPFFPDSILNCWQSPKTGEGVYVGIH